MATRTLPRGASIGVYPRGDGVRFAEVVARDIGCSVPTARRRLNVYPAIRHWSVAAVRAYQTLGLHTALARFLSPLETEAAGLEPLPVDDALLAFAHSTCAVQLARDAYQGDRGNLSVAIALIRTIDCQRSALLRLRHALVAWHGLI